MGPPPIADVWVPLQGGVEALYGLNGAGKTRLLRSIADLYVGRGNGYLVARVVPAADDAVAQDSFPQAFAEPLRFPSDPGWMALIDDAPWKLADRPGWQESVREALWSRLWFGSKNPSEGDDGQYLIRQLDEVLAQGLFALSPLGNGSVWSVEPAVLIDGSTPSLGADADRLLQMASEFFGEASRRVPGNPYATDGEHSDELEEILQEIAKGRATHGDSVITTMTPLFDALRDCWPDYFGQEASLLEQAALIPYRLGASDVMDSQPVTLTGSIASVTRYDELSVEAANTRTREMMGSTPGPLVEVSDGSVVIGEQLADSASDLSMLANLIYTDLLADAPDLFIEVGEPETWFNSSPAEWMACDLAGQEIGIDQLSEAQGRWALVAISLALDLKEYDPGIVGIDPSLSIGRLDNGPSLMCCSTNQSAALHATAQRHAVNGLAQVAMAATGPPSSARLSSPVECSRRSATASSAGDAGILGRASPSRGSVAAVR